MIIAFAGNPNSGKTTLFNALTGGSERVGNWAGVTVEKKFGNIKKKFVGEENITAVDLPGAYSIAPFTGEEGITTNFIKNENVDVIINIVDATNIGRSLFFTTQLMEFDTPVVVALNKADLADRGGYHIDVDKLSAQLGCPVVETVSTAFNDDGVKKLVATAIAAKNNKIKPAFVAKEKDAKKADKERFDFVSVLTSAVETKDVPTHEVSKQDKADKILAHKWFGLPIFAVIMYFVFKISQEWVGIWIADFIMGGAFTIDFTFFGLNLCAIDIETAFIGIEGFAEWMGGIMENANPFLTTLIVDGIINGVGAVVGFIPLIMVMFFLIALLEDCGYMARIAVLMDRYLKKVGLSGKAILPVVIGVGCGIPGVMATRTIKNDRERRTTAMVCTFIPCGAKLPVIALLAGVFFSGSAFVTFAMYILGLLVIFFGALLITKITNTNVSEKFFIMELSNYKTPDFGKAAMSMLDRAKHFIIKAATIIVVCNLVVTVMSSFTWTLAFTEEASESILAAISTPFAILLVPIGLGMWQLAAASITGFIAKENVVATVAIVFPLMAGLIDEETLELVGDAAEAAAAMGVTTMVALSFLVFNLFTPPCFAAIGAMNSEMKSKKWLWGAIGFQFAVGYVLAFVVYTVGCLFTDIAGLSAIGVIAGLVVCAGIAVAMIAIAKKFRKEDKKASLLIAG